ncbi:MAG: arylsulfatase A-like enzyme [Verrucomicrobiales bacterium]|jgi:arylsulfatase A-like enzyme
MTISTKRQRQSFFCMQPILHKVLFALLASGTIASADPLIHSWYTDGTGKYARIYETTATATAGPGAAVTTWDRGEGNQAQPTYVGVNEVSYTETDVYVRSTGLGSHIMGPWYLNVAKTNLFPNYPANLAVIYRFPRDPGTVPVTKSLTGLGRIGMFVDGVSMFDTRDAFSYDTSAGQDDNPMAGGAVTGDDVWNRDAYVNESVTFDAGNAHQARSHYHYHANPPGLRFALGDSVDHDPGNNTYTENFDGGHSPILGWVRDGYPVYGPYAYSDALDADSAVTRMRSGFQKRNITQRQALPAVAARDQGYTAAGSSVDYTLPENLYGPDVTAGAGSQYELGHFLEDYEFLGDLGQVQGSDFDLDQHNGRFCVTPEFPAGTYAYFVSIEVDGTPKFPYNIGRSYYGNPDADEVNSIPAGTTIAFEGGPEKSLEAGELEFGADEVTVSWSAIEGGTYVAQKSTDLQTWDAMDGATLNGDTLSAIDGDVEVRKFYRAKLLDIGPFDDAGFDVQEAAAQVSTAGNNVLLIIVDDWGIDSSPIDNPGAARNASMPNLQWLADNGLRFTNAYAQPVCSPTRATAMTGRYAFRHGVGSPQGATLPTDELALPEAFAAAGSPYALASFGKWHLGGGATGPATLGGWPEFAGILQGAVADYWDWDKTINGTTTAVTDTYTTTDQVNDSIDFIAAQGANPWLCWLALNAPHTPFHEPDASLLPSNPTGSTGRDLYEKVLEAMDTEIGRLLASVDLTKTNVLLIGDNGTPGQVVQAPFGNGNAKGSLYEGGTHVPFVAYGPDVIASGTNDSPVHCVDLFSTILALSGINPASVATNALDSRNLLPNFCGAETQNCLVMETFGTNINNPGRAILDGGYKLIIFDDPAVTTDTPSFELYNIGSDPGEASELLADGSDAGEQAIYDSLLAKNTALGGGFGETDGGGGGGEGTPVSSGILELSPDSGTPGTTLTVTFNFDDNWPQNVPRLTNMAGNAITPTLTIGGVTGSNVSRPSRYVATATFTLPAGAGFYDAGAVFPGPNTPTFGRTFAFEVTP